MSIGIRRSKVQFTDKISQHKGFLSGVSQGCTQSFSLVNKVYSEKICQESLAESLETIFINGEININLRCANKIIIFADNLLDLQNLIKLNTK